MIATMDFAGMTGVVTGGASGIGRGIAEAMIARGVRVMIADIEENVCRTTAQEIGSAWHVADVADPESIEALASAAVTQLGGVNLLFNNAGVGPAAMVKDMSLDDWRWMLDVNLWGVIHGIHYFLPIMRESGRPGHIVNTASLSGMVSMAGRAAYAASKFGVVAITEALAAELEAEQSAVSASILFPGATRTAIGSGSRNRPSESRGALRDWELKPDENNLQARKIRILEPREIGEIALDGVARGDLYIQSHSEFLAFVEARNRKLERSLGGQ